MEYLDDIADGSPWKSNIDDSLDADVRRLLRFYNQLSVLIEKQLIDEDFVFTMIGPGLVTAWPVLESALSYYEFYYPRDDKVDWQTEPRLIYDVFTWFISATSTGARSNIDVRSDVDHSNNAGALIWPDWKGMVRSATRR